jgi:chemotaxis protein CheX
MDVKYINPFIQALNHTMQTMLGKEPERQALALKTNNLVTGDISAIIGFAGKNVHGSIALCFPEKLAVLIYRRVFGEGPTHINREVEDIIGEIANIVAGGAKTELENCHLIIHNSIPSVIVGKDHVISHKSSSPFITIPFLWEGHGFSMEVSMKVETLRPTHNRTEIKSAAASAKLEKPQLHTK